MMFVKQLSTIMLAGALLLTGCAGRTPAPQAELPQPPQRLAQADAQVNRPEGLPRPASPRLGNRAGDRQPLAGDGERQAGQALPVPVNGEQRAAIPDYDAAQMLTTFAQSYLGITPTVVRAQGTSGDLILPPQISQKINGSVNLAGQVSAGMITVGDQRGAAQVAVGGGSISGDLQADISNGALGAYSLLLPGVATPSDAGAALALLTSTYPGLAAYDLQPETGGQGYVFRAVTTTPGLDLQTQQATVVAQVVVAGVSGQGRAAVVWVVVGNGTFAVAL
jgi:hypothetical protein